MERKAAKSSSPQLPELLTMEMICWAWLSRLRALMVLSNSSVVMLPLPSQSKTSKTSLSLQMVSALSFLVTYLEGSNVLAVDLLMSTESYSLIQIQNLNPNNKAIGPDYTQWQKKVAKFSKTMKQNANCLNSIIDCSIRHTNR